MMFQYFIPVVVFLGFLASLIIKHYTKDEHASSLTFFKILQKIIVGILTLITLFLVKENYILFGVGVIIGFFLTFVDEYLFIGLLLVTTLKQEMIILTASISFIYGLPYAFVNTWSSKKVIFIAVVFSIPFLLLFLPDMSVNVLIVGLIAGRFVNLMIKKTR